MILVLQGIARLLLLVALPSLVAVGWTFGCGLGRWFVLALDLHMRKNKPD